jgi:glutaredoxin
MIEVVVYSKPGCCLCDEVKAQLGKLREIHSFQLREVNILDDPAAYEQFKEGIPRYSSPARRRLSTAWRRPSFYAH